MGLHSEPTACVRGSNADTNTVRVLPGAAAGFFPAAGNRRQDSCLPGKTEAQRGLAPRKNRGRARLGAGTNPVRDLLGAAAHPEPAAGVRDAGKKQTGQNALQAADALQAATRVTSLPLQTALRRDGACANCPPQVCSAQPRAFSLPGKTEVVRGPAPGKNRVRARRGEERDTVRVLPGAAARIARRGRVVKGVQILERGVKDFQLAAICKSHYNKRTNEHR